MFFEGIYAKGGGGGGGAERLTREGRYMEWRENVRDRYVYRESEREKREREKRDRD